MPGQIVIEVMLSDYPFDFLGTVRKRAAEFEQAHPEYRVKIRGCYYEDLPAAVAAVTAAGNPPTIASYYSGATQQARDTRTPDGRPLFTSVERAIGGRTEILGEPVILDDLIAACRAFYTIDGEIAAVPLTLSTMLLYSNTTILRAAGVAPPRTWDEVTSVCKAVAALPDAPPHPITWPDDGKLFQQALTQQGAQLVTPDNGRTGRATTVDLTSAGMSAYVHWWRELNEAGHYLYTGTFEDWENSIKAMVERRVAMRFSSSFEINPLSAAGARLGFDVEAGPIPYNGDIPAVGNWIGGDALWLAADLDEPTRDGALAFILYLNNPRNVAEWHKESGSTPTTYPAIALLEEEGWFAAHPEHRVATDQLECLGASVRASAPVIPGSHGVQTAIMAAMEDVLVRGADPRARFAEAEIEAQRALEAYNTTCQGDGPRDPRWVLVGT